MHSYRATIHWQRGEAVFAGQQYSRAHQWQFDGELTVPAAASPLIVDDACTDASAVDPEEAFVASISSCHMLWFLSIASKQGYTVETYTDEASGIMDTDKDGNMAITHVTLKPEVRFGQANIPEQHVFEKMHQQAHQNCFIAHSVKTEISVNANLRGIP